MNAAINITGCLQYKVDPYSGYFYYSINQTILTYELEKDYDEYNNIVDMKFNLISNISKLHSHFEIIDNGLIIGCTFCNSDFGSVTVYDMGDMTVQFE